MSWWFVAGVVGKVLTACFATGPIYREYLR
jgi:hypothetical protein